MTYNIEGIKYVVVVFFLFVFNLVEDTTKVSVLEEMHMYLFASHLLLLGMPVRVVGQGCLKAYGKQYENDAN